MHKILFILLPALLSFNAHAKKQIKIGCVDMSKVLEAMPETKRIQTELEIFSKELQIQLDTKVEELTKEIETFRQGYNTMNENAKKQKEIELQILQNSIQQLRAKGEDSLAEKRTELLDPVINRIMDVVKKIARDGVFTHVLTKENGLMYSNILYIDNEFDITNDVIQAINNAAANDKTKK